MKRVILLSIVFCLTLNIKAQRRVSPDSLDLNQLSLYKAKATRLRNGDQN